MFSDFPENSKVLFPTDLDKLAVLISPIFDECGSKKNMGDDFTNGNLFSSTVL